jgi:hypothetical protein
MCQYLSDFKMKFITYFCLFFNEVHKMNSHLEDRGGDGYHSYMELHETGRLMGWTGLG